METISIPFDTIPVIDKLWNDENYVLSRTWMLPAVSQGMCSKQDVDMFFKSKLLGLAEIKNPKEVPLLVEVSDYGTLTAVQILLKAFTVTHKAGSKIQSGRVIQSTNWKWNILTWN